MNKRIFVSLGILSVMFFGLSAQDIIVTRDSKKIEAKVTEVNRDDVKYKVFTNQEGPTYTLPKSDIASIVYQNGQVDTFETPASAPSTPAQTAAAAPRSAGVAPTPEIRGPHRKNFYAGVYVNPLSIAVLNGASLGAELTFARKFIVEPYLRFPTTSLYFVLEEDAESGLGFGMSAKFFTGGRYGGFYVGPNVECNLLDFEDVFLFLGVNLGYKFQFSSGFYMRAGASLGTQIEIDYETLPWGNLEFCFGFAF